MIFTGSVTKACVSWNECNSRRDDKSNSFFSPAPQVNVELSSDPPQSLDEVDVDPSGTGSTQSSGISEELVSLVVLSDFLLTFLVACLVVEEFAVSTIASNRGGGSFRALTS